MSRSQTRNLLPPFQKPPRSRLNMLGGTTLLITVTILAYLPAVKGGFVWDDSRHVTGAELRSVEGLYRIWFDLGATQQYYPLLHSAFWVEYQLWGAHSLGYHLVNLALHVAAAWLVYLILQKLNVPGAWLAAAIFALHPVEVESVAWISEQKNTLSAVFYLGAMLVYLGFDDTRKLSLYALAFALFVLGLLTKTVTATLPAALLVIFWWQRGTLSWRRDVLPLVPWFVLGAIAGLFTAWVERKLIGAEGAEFELTLLQRTLLAGRAIWFYLGKLVWPTNLIFIYPRWKVDPDIWWQWLFPLGAVAVLVVLWAIRRRWRGPLASWLFFVGTLLPVLGFLNVYPFRYSFVADHFQYLASLGMIVFAASGIALTLSRLPQRAQWVSTALSIVLLATLSTLTWRQSRMYDDVFALYQTTIDRNLTCWMAYHNLGNELLKAGRPQEAVARYQEVLRLKPHHPEAHNNLGGALIQCGRLEEAIAHYEMALHLNADNPDIENNLGNALANAGRLPEAISHFERSLQLNPDHMLANANLASAYSHLGRFSEAVTLAQHALKVARSSGQTAIARQFEKNLKVYLSQQTQPKGGSGP